MLGGKKKSLEMKERDKRKRVGGLLICGPVQQINAERRRHKSEYFISTYVNLNYHHP
jgi:hypothetical protein